MRKMKRKSTVHGVFKKKYSHFLGQRKLDEVYESDLASSRTSS
jgi:hypothetical protein